MPPNVRSRRGSSHVNIFFDETPGPPDASYNRRSRPQLGQGALQWRVVHRECNGSDLAYCCEEAGAHQPNNGGQQMQCSPKVQQVIEMIFALDDEEQEQFAQIIVQVIREELREHPRATIN
jgi:hypothetical protein